MTANEPLSTSGQVWVLVATILGASLAFIDATVANVALPVLQKELGATLAETQWVVEIYVLFITALLLVGGALGDAFGRKKIYSLGIVLFAVSSLFSGLATTPTWLILMRAVQGIGGALLIPGSLALLRANFPESESGRAIGTWSAFSALVSVAGPLLGGFLIQHGSWRWIFFINLPVAAAALALLHWKVAESKSARTQKLDLAGALLEIFGLGLLVFGLIEAGHEGFEPARVRLALAAGAALLFVFLVHEARAPAPMMPLALFRSRTFTGVNLLTFFLYGALTGLMFFTQFALLQVQGFTPMMAGAFFSPIALCLFFFSSLAGRIAARTGPRLPLTMGPLLVAAGLFLFTRAGRDASYWFTYFPAILLLGAGMTLLVAPLTNTAMSCVPGEFAGLASGINNAIARAGGLFAIALLGIVLQFSFNASLDRRLARIDLTPETRAALDRERDRLAAATIPSGLTPGSERAARTAIQKAFLDGYRDTLLACVALTVTGALVAFLMVRGGGRSKSPGIAGGSV